MDQDPKLGTKQLTNLLLVSGIINEGDDISSLEEALRLLEQHYATTEESKKAAKFHFEIVNGILSKIRVESRDTHERNLKKIKYIKLANSLGIALFGDDYRKRIIPVNNILIRFLSVNNVSDADFRRDLYSLIAISAEAYEKYGELKGLSPEELKENRTFKNLKKLDYRDQANFSDNFIITGEVQSFLKFLSMIKSFAEFKTYFTKLGRDASVRIERYLFDRNDLTDPRAIV